jgi:acyl carrier protein
LYKTGDRGCWRADGNIEYLGRNDFQVKLRGFRIEPGEIEARLLEHHSVREAVVLVREDLPGEKRLVAYIVSDTPVPAEALRSHLHATLPEYMTPGAFVALAALPRSPNGKLDRRALPAPDAAAVAHQTYEPPQGEVEVGLAAIWADVLKVDRIGRHDNFFDLGGHSLLVMKVVARVREVFEIDVSLETAFQATTLAALAGMIRVRQIERYQASDIERISAEVSVLSEEELRALLNRQGEREHE